MGAKSKRYTHYSVDPDGTVNVKTKKSPYQKSLIVTLGGCVFLLAVLLLGIILLPLI